MSISAVKPVTRDAEGTPGTIRAEKLVNGSSETRSWDAFSDKSEQFHVGHWGSGPCVIDVSYTENELCVLVQGRAKITDTDGASLEFGTGEAFVIEAGFKGTWESIGDVVKIYAIFEDNQ
ncbi:MAG: cupin domain-containing protein [Pseudomonadota bacterium]